MGAAGEYEPQRQYLCARSGAPLDHSQEIGGRVPVDITLALPRDCEGDAVAAGDDPGNVPQPGLPRADVTPLLIAESVQAPSHHGHARAEDMTARADLRNPERRWRELGPASGGPFGAGALPGGAKCHPVKVLQLVDCSVGEHHQTLPR